MPAFKFSDIYGKGGVIDNYVLRGYTFTPKKGMVVTALIVPSTGTAVNRRVGLFEVSGSTITSVLADSGIVSSTTEQIISIAPVTLVTGKTYLLGITGTSSIGSMSSVPTPNFSVDTSDFDVTGYRHIGYINDSSVPLTNAIGKSYDNENSSYFDVGMVYTINTPPSAPSSITSSDITSGQTYNGLKEATWTIGNATDLDGNPLTYELDFYDGSRWINIAKNIPSGSPTQVKMILPNKNITGAKVRARAYDGTDYSSYLESGAFNIQQVTGVQLPNALTFDGIDDYVNIPNRIVPTGDFTIELMFKTDSTNPSGEYLFDINEGSNYGFRLLHVNGQLQLHGFSSGNITASGSYNDNRIHHVAITRSGNTFELFVDGVSKGTKTDTLNFSTYNNFKLGSAYNGQQKFKGVISLPRFWNDVRTVQELNDGKFVTYPTSEQGYLDELLFDVNTAQLKTRVGGVIADLYGGVQFAYRFVPLVSLSLPSAVPFTKANIDYIRQKVNEFRQANGLRPYSWTDPVIIPKVTPVKAVHLNEIQQAINEVYTQTGTQFVSPTVQLKVREQVLPKNPKFKLKDDFPDRLTNILKALQNIN